MGVIQAPRVQLATGLVRTREISTSLPAARQHTGAADFVSSNQGRPPKAGA